MPAAAAPSPTVVPLHPAKASIASAKRIYGSVFVAEVLVMKDAMAYLFQTIVRLSQE
jgi:hypothetical protein